MNKKNILQVYEKLIKFPSFIIRIKGQKQVQARKEEGKAILIKLLHTTPHSEIAVLIFMKHDSHSFCLDTQRLILYSNLQKAWKIAPGAYLIYRKPNNWQICVPFTSQRHLKNPQNIEVPQYYRTYESCASTDKNYGVWQCISEFPIHNPGGRFSQGSIELRNGDRIRIHDTVLDVSWK